MAVIKAVSSHASIGKAIGYITNMQKTELELIGGVNCSPSSAIDEMQATKELYGKTGGRTYKHFIQSFHSAEEITAKGAFEIAYEFAEKCPLFKGFEVVFATHVDKDHIHTHFIVNSVSCDDGHKFQMTTCDLKNMKELSDNLCRENELKITEKGKTFEGEIREETVSYEKDTYNRLKQAEQGKVKSFVFDIALKVLEEKESAVSKEGFISSLNEKGIGVDWQDNHKYITFTDLSRQELGEKQCKVRDNKLEKYFNIDFSKKGLSREFERNLQRENGSERADTGINGEKEIGIREQSVEGSFASAKQGVREVEDRLCSIDERLQSIVEGVFGLTERDGEESGISRGYAEGDCPEVVKCDGRSEWQHSDQCEGSCKESERDIEINL